MPNFTFKSRRRQWTLIQTPFVSPLQYAPNVGTTVLPLRYRPSVPARRVILLRTPVLSTSPTGVNPARTVFVPHRPFPVARPIAWRMVIPNHTPPTVGGILRNQPPVRVPLRVRQPVRPILIKSPNPIPILRYAVDTIKVAKAGLPRRAAAKPIQLRSVANQAATALQKITVVRVPRQGLRQAPANISKQAGLGRGFTPITRPTVVIAGRPTRVAKPIRLIMPTGGVAPPPPSSSRVIRSRFTVRVVYGSNSTGREAIRAIQLQSPFVGNAKPPGKTVTQSRIILPTRRPVVVSALHSVPFTGVVIPPRPPVVLRVSPKLTRPIRPLAVRALFTSPTAAVASFRPNIIALRRSKPMLPPRSSILGMPLPANGLPPSIIAASLLWLRRIPAVVNAFGDSTGSIKFGSDYLGQVSYPIVRFSEPEEQQMFETVDNYGRTPIVTEGAFVVEVTSDVGKTDCRALGDLIGNTLTDASLSWTGASLMYLRQSKRQFPVTVETSADGKPSLFRRQVEFLYMFESYETH